MLRDIHDRLHELIDDLGSAHAAHPDASTARNLMQALALLHAAADTLDDVHIRAARSAKARVDKAA